MCRRHRWQASSHRFAVYALFLQHQENLWGLACQR